MVKQTSGTRRAAAAAAPRRGGLFGRIARGAVARARALGRRVTGRG